MILVITLIVLTASCKSVQPVSVLETPHRFFLEVDRPGAVYSVLQNPKQGGAMLRLVEVDVTGRPISDTLQTWVQHYNGRKRFSNKAAEADLVIACHREKLPPYVRPIHVLPESTGEVYVYMMQKGVLVVSDDKISFYEFLIAARKTQSLPDPSSL